VIIVVAGVSGCGKTTVAALLSGSLGWPFTDGDLMHPTANIAKMTRGIPLTDEDRMPWLRTVAGWMDERIAAGESAIVACSALKRSYRDQLLAGRPSARIAFLLVDRGVVALWMAARQGHFFDARLLGSQFADLELPAPDESSVVVVPVEGRPQDTADEVIRLLGLGGSQAHGGHDV
jgi:gluconokinase